MPPTPSQTLLRNLSKARCWELLRTQEVGRLAVATNGHPDVFPVNFRVVGASIIIRTDDGGLLQRAIQSPSVAFEADALNRSAHTGWSVVVKGSASEPEHMEDYLRSQDAAVEPWPAGEKERYVIVEVDTISGRVLPPATSSAFPN